MTLYKSIKISFIDNLINNLLKLGLHFKSLMYNTYYFLGTPSHID